MNIQNDTNTNNVADYIVSLLRSHLQNGKKVLWLVPGGSAIIIVQAVLQKISQDSLDNLAISLTDERYGALAHADENWNVIFSNAPTLKGANLVLVNTGDSLQQTTAAYAANLQQLFAWADVHIGFFGMGADGHTAGILPNSPAASSTDYAASYDAGNFVRVTMTPAAIQQLDHAILYAVGPEKLPMLTALQQQIDIQTMPAQALKSVPQFDIFTDQKLPTSKGEL